MGFFRIFFGSFYSQALYARLRFSASGYGVRYSFLLFALVGVVTSTVLLMHMPGQSHAVLRELQSYPPAKWLVILLVALLMRAGMLFALAIGARLIGLALRTPLDYPAALRVTAAAYTPVTLMDAVAIATLGIAVSPYYLFGAGLVMLLAALAATR